MTSAPSPMPPDPESDETLFAAALQWDTAKQRAAYLDEACAGNPDRRLRVEELLRASDEAKTFLERPVGQPRNPAGSMGPAGSGPASKSTSMDPSGSTEGPGTRIGRWLKPAFTLRTSTSRNRNWLPATSASRPIY